jgi:hypothetical protein
MLSIAGNYMYDPVFSSKNVRNFGYGERLLSLKQDPVDRNK